MQISKPRKTELFILVLACIITLTSFLNFRSLHAKFHNKTGEDIDSLIVAGYLIGQLKNNEVTESISFKEFMFDDSAPYEEISGVVNNKKLHSLHWSWCGTGRNTRYKGSYAFDIKKEVDEKGNACLYLVEHNKKIFWEEE